MPLVVLFIRLLMEVCPKQPSLKYVCAQRDTTWWLTQTLVGDTVVLRLCVHARSVVPVCVECQRRAAVPWTRRHAAASSIQTSSLGKTNLGSEMT